MAEGGDTTFENPAYDPYDDPYDDDRFDETTPFIPQTSTPYHAGEQIQTFSSEHSGLPDTSYVDAPQLADLTSNEFEKAREYIKSKFPRVNFKKLGPIGFGKKTNTQTKIVLYGPKGGETPIFKKDGGLQKSFTDKFKTALGPTAEQIIAEKTAELKVNDQEIAVNESHEQQLDEEIEKQMREMKQNKSKSFYTQTRIDVVKQQHGENASDSELRRLEREKRDYSRDAEKNQKKIEDLEKQKKQTGEKISRKKARGAEILKEKNQTEEQLNRTKSLNELNSRETELLQQRDEKQAIIDSEDTSPSERQAAREQVEEINEEIARLQPRIAEREEALPLRERIKEIFKKHGVTVAAIVIAAGVTIGAVMSSITKGLKATGKAMAGGLKEIGAKLGSLLPGLIGQVAHFLFNTAAKAVGFLAEHTWLIILAVVAFLFEKYIKKR